MNFSHEQDELSRNLALEKYLIDSDDWKKRRDEMPEQCREIVDEKPTDASYGIGKEKRGWFVLATQGQGPVLVWAAWEKETENDLEPSTEDSDPLDW